MMELPDNLDALLAELRETKTDGQVQCTAIDPDDLAFIQRILDSLKTGSKGIFAVVNPDDRVGYIFLNTNQAGAFAVLGQVMARLVERLNDEV
jgi:hypothetical protein